MSDTPQGPGWWQASDGRWYAPELHPDARAAAAQDATAQQPTPDPTVQQPAPQQPPATPPATPPSAPGAPAGPPTGAPPPSGTPPTGATPPYGAGPDGTFVAPAATSTPPGAPPAGGGGSGGKVALIVGIVVLVALVAGGLAFALTSGDDGDDEAADETTTTTESLDPPVTRTLLPRSTTTDGSPSTSIDVDDLVPGLGEDVEPEVLLCIGLAIEDDPDLADAASNPSLSPDDPSTAALLQVLVDCGGRSILEESFVSQFDAGPRACVEDVLASLDDQDFVTTLLDVARINETGSAPGASSGALDVIACAAVG